MNEQNVLITIDIYQARIHLNLQEVAEDPVAVVAADNGQNSLLKGKIYILK